MARGGGVCGGGDGKNTNQERPLDWKTLKADCFLTGSHLPDKGGVWS